MKSITVWKIVLSAVSLYTILIWIAAFKFSPSLSGGEAKLIACDVGQGDAILISLNSTQILIDGGPNNDVINCLSRHLPFWDRTLELVISTHPESDHYQGLIEVFRRYKVRTFLASSLENSAQSYQVLKDLVAAEGSQVLFAEDTSGLKLGLIYLDILHPSHDFFVHNSTTADHKVLGTTTSKLDRNDFSVIIELKIGDYKALFTGDVLPEASAQIKGLSDVDVLKIPHHGSKNGLTQEMLEKTTPEVALISVGKNQWGHPNQETLDLLNKYNVNIRRTDQEGDIVIPLN